MIKKTPQKSNYKYWIFAIIVILLSFPLFRFIRKQLQLNKQQNQQLENDSNYLVSTDEVLLNTSLNLITPRKDIQQAAKDLAHHLGTKYSDKNNWYDFLDPWGWTENDDEVEKILIYQRKNYGLLILLYKKVTNSRSLSADILKYLDKDNLARVRKYLKI